MLTVMVETVTLMVILTSHFDNHVDNGHVDDGHFDTLFDFCVLAALALRIKEIDLTYSIC